MVKMTLMIIRSSEVQASLCRQAFHPRHTPFQSCIHLEAIRFCIVETVVQLRLHRSLSWQSGTPGSRPLRHPVTIHGIVEHTFTIGRFIVVRSITVQVESKFQTLVAQQHGVCVQNHVHLFV